jgi:hypothetical protein
MKHPPKTKIKCKKSCTEEQNEADQQILFIEKNKKKIPLLLPKHCGSMHHHNCSARKTTARKQTLNSIKTLHRERIKRPPPSMKISINGNADNDKKGFTTILMKSMFVNFISLAPGCVNLGSALGYLT